MSGTTYLLITITFFLAFAVSYAWYKRAKVNGPLFWGLFALRGLALWALALMLINPVYRQYENYIEKPLLQILVDNSASMGYLSDTAEVKGALSALKESTQLQENFDIRWYGFDEDLVVMDSYPDFRGVQTNIAKALQRSSKLQRTERDVTLMISDGNTTYGGDYQYNTAQVQGRVYTLIAGDTTRYEDLYLERVNVNRYAYLNNKFPVEIFIGYEGSETVKTTLELSRGNRVLYKKDMSLDPSAAGIALPVELEASVPGVHTYQVRLLPLEQEKNTSNNTSTFAVEVIDERYRVAIIASGLHPDLGSLRKSIESSGQRMVEILTPDAVNTIAEYDLLILYQPDRAFTGILEQITDLKRNFWLIGGEGTDWNFVNQAQNFFEREVTYTTELALGEVNSGYSGFQFDDPGFHNYPPLKTYLGDFIIIDTYEALIRKNIEGVATDKPLLFTSERNGHRIAVLDANDLWKWRMQHYAIHNTFEEYDAFILKLVQYLSGNTRKERLHVDYAPYYYSNSPIRVTAGYYDKNYQFDEGENLQLEITDAEGNTVKSIAMVAGKGVYEAVLSGLTAGSYKMLLRVPSQNLSRQGEFTVLGYEVERQFINTDNEKMQYLAEATGGKMVLLNEIPELLAELINQKEYTPIQKQRSNNVPLLEWQWLLFLTAGLFALEWFTRKYNGLI